MGVQIYRQIWFNKVFQRLHTVLELSASVMLLLAAVTSLLNGVREVTARALMVSWV